MEEAKTEPEKMANKPKKSRPTSKFGKYGRSGTSDWHHARWVEYAESMPQGVQIRNEHPGPSPNLAQQGGDFGDDEHAD